MSKPITPAAVLNNAKQREVFDQVTTTASLLPQAMGIIGAAGVDVLNDVHAFAKLANDLAEAVAAEFVVRTNKKLKDAGL